MKFKKIWNLITLIVLLLAYSMIATRWVAWNYATEGRGGTEYNQMTDGIYVIYSVFILAFIGLFIEDDYHIVQKDEPIVDETKPKETKIDEAKPSVTKPKKMVRRRVAIALGIICILLMAVVVCFSIMGISAQNSYHNLQNQNNQLQAWLDDNITYLQNQKNQLQTWLNGNITNYETRLSALNNQINQLQTWLNGNTTSYISQINSLNSQITSLNAQITNLISQQLNTTEINLRLLLFNSADYEDSPNYTRYNVVVQNNYPVSIYNCTLVLVPESNQETPSTGIPMCDLGTLLPNTTFSGVVEVPNSVANTPTGYVYMEYAYGFVVPQTQQQLTNTITYVSPITAVNNQTIIIMGHGFGSVPPTTNVGDGSVDMPNFKISQGDGSGWGSDWNAGCTDQDDLIGVYLLSWNDTTIVLGGFGSFLTPTNNCYFVIGDNITVTVNGATWTTIVQSS